MWAGPAGMCASDENCSMALAKNARFCSARGISTLWANEMGFPLSRDSASASCALLCEMSCANFLKQAARRSTGVVLHVGKARAAAAYAWSTSDAFDRGNRPVISPVAGSIWSSHSPSFAGFNSDPIKFNNCSMPPR